MHGLRFPWLWRAFALAATLLASGCATSGLHQPATPVAGEPAVSCDTQLQPEHQVQLDRVDSLASEAKPYAALARLESEGLATEPHWLRYGRLLATTQRLEEASEVFQALADRCGSSAGHHGLGLVRMKRGNVEQGLAQLARARELDPASAQIRNDYGYALLLAGRADEAVFELRTALELAEGQGAARQNLAAAYLLTDDRAGLDMLKARYDFGLDEFAHADQLASELGVQP